MGVYDDGKNYLLGGLKYVSRTEYSINSDVHVYENGSWSERKLTFPNKRIDGTIHFDKATKIVALIGGFKIKANDH